MTPSERLRMPIFVLMWLVAAAQPAQAARPTLAACDAGFQAVLVPAPASAPLLPARAIWLDGQRLRWGGLPAQAQGRFVLAVSNKGQIVAAPGQPLTGADQALPLHAVAAPTEDARFAWFGAGLTLSLAAPQRPGPGLRGRRALHQQQTLLAQLDSQGHVLQATRVQHAAALDDLFAGAELEPALGAQVRPAAGGRAQTRFKLWAPTAQQVTLCLHADARAPAQQALAMRRDSATGLWAARWPQDLSGHYYTYLVDVFVPGVGLVRNRVTDPYALSLNADSRRTWIGSLDAPGLKPAGWDQTPRPARVQQATDMVIYELHVRDFSVGDLSVPAAHRGKYSAFAEATSDGMQHLRKMSEAGLTDVHLLPVFDLATVPEKGCVSPTPPAGLPPDSEAQQAAVMASAAEDCFNWGYDPFHFTAPEGSFASDADDGAVRILEFRRMVQALHKAGLRVGMDVVYNHTTASGQHEKSVLDRIVPGYYQRLDREGRVETSTCCDNTATEHRMMAKLMIDSAVVWARDHRIDSFRFDLMGHQPRAAMERLQTAVNRAAGRPIHLIGEGWNFGEVKDGARFVQASQLSLNGSGIATFSDRGRDAARGGGCCDNAQDTVQRQGWLNGLHFAPNGSQATPATQAELLQAADMVRVGLAGTLRDFRLHTFDGSEKTMSQIVYAGQIAGYASQPGEVVNYVENHDNQTLFDIHALKLPRATSSEDRARVQVLGMALTAFSQGVAYFHAGIEALRSKSGDRNSYDSGDWFNRLDWTFSDNHWGTGLPPQRENAALWPALKPLLADPALKPRAQDIRFTRDAFYDLLRLRASSTLFRLSDANAVMQRLRFLNTGPQQVPTVMAAHLDGRGLAGAGFAELVYFINAGTDTTTLLLPSLQGKPLNLHPVHLASGAADKRPAQGARWEADTGRVTLPARSALVYVLR
jgi:pullulanase